MRYSRRQIVQLALASVPGARLLTPAALGAFQGKTNSKVNGVQIGMNVPYNFGGRNMPADQLLQNLITLNVSGVEMRTQPVETYMGAPATLIDGRGNNPGVAEELAKWRLAAPMDKARAFRKMYNDAGVLVEIVKVDGLFGLSDPVVDYVFTLAKTLGARALSTEIAAEGPERIGKFADKHGLMVGYHGHAETGPEAWEKLFAYAKHNGANLDIGHFVAGNHGSPIPFLKEHHDRITHIHVKDRKKDEGPAVPFGEGDVPVVEVLQLIRDNKWPIQATIEFEYKVPEGSDRMTELKKCMDFCRKALAS
jgi:sugar phosphate isomerase/epimerase